MSKIVIGSALALLLSGVAGAGSFREPVWSPPSFPGGPRFEAPEIEPASAVGAMTLLLGALVVLRSRKTAK